MPLCLSNFVQMANFQDGVHSRKSTSGYIFSDSSRVTMFKSISTPNFHLNPRLSYYYFQFLKTNVHHIGILLGFNFDLPVFIIMCTAFCIGLLNLKFLLSTVPEIYRGSQNSKSGSCDHLHGPFDLILHLFDSTPCGKSACQI